MKKKKKKNMIHVKAGHISKKYCFWDADML